MNTLYVILALAVTLLTCVVMIGILVLNNHPSPDVLELLAVGSLTALAGILAPSAGRHSS